MNQNSRESVSEDDARGVESNCFSEGTNCFCAGGAVVADRPGHRRGEPKHATSPFEIVSGRSFGTVRVGVSGLFTDRLSLAGRSQTSFQCPDAS